MPEEKLKNIFHYIIPVVLQHITGFFFHPLFQIPATKLPVGRHTWEMVTEICDTEESELAITSCKKDKFTCKTGKCIPLSYRCDIYQVRGEKRENNQV